MAIPVITESDVRRLKGGVEALVSKGIYSIVTARGTAKRLKATHIVREGDDVEGFLYVPIKHAEIEPAGSPPKNEDLFDGKHEQAGEPPQEPAMPKTKNKAKPDKASIDQTHAEMIAAAEQKRRDAETALVEATIRRKEAKNTLDYANGQLHKLCAVVTDKGIFNK